MKILKINESVYDDFVKFDNIKNDYIDKLTRLQNETKDEDFRKRLLIYINEVKDIPANLFK